MSLTPLAKTVVEGAISCAVGHDVSDNPYDTLTAREQHDLWRWSWNYADALLAHVADRGVREWLEQQDDAA